ncbi:hypothetical protein CK203_022400 [Vitis vinifera]|uniref:Uncharacterized protein n=1 Tax=Vitis vinifera TaxID=29760 RepID=A0A438I934_VITVI|nr:hypothetical protein CK203_022400 [Vitis vinifera]
MATHLAISLSPVPAYSSSSSLHFRSSLLPRWTIGMEKLKAFSSSALMGYNKRRTLICAVNQDAEKLFQKTVEVDRLIDMLREANANEKDYEELALSVMSIVDRLVHKTKQKIESATDVLKEILRPVVDEEEEISWPPRDPEALSLMEKVTLFS